MRFSRIKIFLLFLVVVFGIYTLIKIPVFKNQSTPTPDFINSRMQSAIISESIVNLSNEIKANIQKINELNLKNDKDYKEAFNLLNEINIKTFNVRQKAIDLSKELEVMTKELANIHAGGAEKFAISAITNRITIINHLLSYSDYLFKLNLALQDNFYGKNNRNEILSLIEKINNEIEAINLNNQKATEEMQKFDEALKNQ